MPGTPTPPRPASWELQATPQLIQRVWQRIGCAIRDEGRDAGFTLLEVVVSFVLFTFVAGGATTGIVNSLKASHESQQRIDAANVAQLYITQARSDATSATRYPDKTYTHSVGNETFTVNRTIAFDDGATQCGVGVTFLVHVTVDQATSGKFLARSDARVSC